MNLKIVHAVQCDKGRRADNDDCVLTDPENGLYAVCDGVSTRIGGRTAAELACQALRKTIPGHAHRLDDNFREHAVNVAEASLQAAHQAIVTAQAGNAELSGMTTTAAMVLHRGNNVLLSHVGDSRVYLYRAPELRQLTRDHSLENYLKDNPHVRPKVKRPGKMLVRALGLRSSKLGAQHSQTTLEQGDLLLICSDGVTDSMPPWTLRELLSGVPYASVSETASCLMRAALSHGSMDNISVILLQATDRPDVTSRTVLFELDEATDNLSVVLGWITFLEGANRGEIVPLQGSTVIGADPACRIVLKGDYVSGRHAEVLASEHGFTLRDLGSTNGTYVNDIKVKEAPLVDGDVVRIGKTPVVFKSHQLERRDYSGGNG